MLRAECKLTIFHACRPSIGSTATSTSPAAASAPPPAELADADENDRLLTLPRPEYNVTIKSDRKTPSTAAGQERNERTL